MLKNRAKVQLKKALFGSAVINSAYWRSTYQVVKQNRKSPVLKNYIKALNLKTLGKTAICMTTISIIYYTWQNCSG
jgi:hypothetical protein